MPAAVVDTGHCAGSSAKASYGMPSLVSSGSRVTRGEVTVGPMSEELESDESPIDEPTVVLERWTGPWEPDDPDANFKSDVALYTTTDPLATIEGLSTNLDIPVGAIVRYVLAKWATGGSGGLLELGPTMTRRLADVCDRAEAAGTDEARLDAYRQLRDMVQWLRLPLDQPDVY